MEEKLTHQNGVLSKKWNLSIHVILAITCGLHLLLGTVATLLYVVMILTGLNLWVSTIIYTILLFIGGHLIYKFLGIPT